MASEKGPVATEAPLATPPATQSAAAAAAAAAISAADLFASDLPRSGSLKRPREATPTSPASVAAATTNPDLSPSKVQRLGLATRHSPAPLTGALADEEERIRKAEEARQAAGISDNPSHRVLDVLMSATMAMSRAQDAPDAAAAAAAPPTSPGLVNSKPTTEVVVPPPQALPKPEPPTEASAGAVPTGQPLDGAMTQVVDSPAPMDIDQRSDQPQGGFVAQPDAQTQEKNTAYSYPGILPPNVSMGGAPAPPQRGMSLPMTSSQHSDAAPRSPTSKKHKCPCCDTVFTRHHNLKSHLLTHSQEKPYACDTCQMRFRRLHDLKRHSKLHTGEKPHICPKCDRKFARGDALARHAKGAGGCAGRRSSMGSFGGEEYDESGVPEGDDSVMSGVLYDTGEADMTEDDRRRLSLSAGVKAQHAVASAPDGFGAHARPYPPTMARPGTTGAMTESPKALSPENALAVQLGPETAQANSSSQRSPSTTAQMAQAYGRRQEPGGAQGAPASTTIGPGPPSGAVNHQAATGAHSRASSGLGHSQNGGSGDSSANLFASGDDGLWAYIHSVDAKWEAAIKQLLERTAGLEAAKSALENQVLYQDNKIGQLTEEVSFLRQQLTASRNETAMTSRRSEPDTQQLHDTQQLQSAQLQLEPPQSQPQPAQTPQEVAAEVLPKE
ncbi:zinc finger protein 740 [Magnaporthiopsis poae ATCC 64411]|uniref:Zinc finger protein 740 n=1 Tax=Magnaporthiopsis poae (strain ATCC 64411 / 73-15) TaxID=644358 RepID=A0A0C4E2M0_MAGP6|nr:zinc finger protein 740 [Magnaporthiopsis poae ATCC 64411]